MTKSSTKLILLLLALTASFHIPALMAQPDQSQMLAVPGQSPTPNPADIDIQQRLASIFAVLEPLSQIEVKVTGGVALLSGVVSNEAQADRALTLASDIPGVVAVGDSIERRLDVEGNLSPMLDNMQIKIKQWARALPLFALASVIFIVIVYLGYALARWSSLWKRITTNPFLVELIGQGVRIITVIAALVLTLNLLGANALMATILGGAGVLGLAVGFAVRDTMENYICSILMSVRQPFRPNDHVMINSHEGKVVRLTSRATVLMTLQGNQLRIPNATVFKAVILNYTLNPQRRFDFELGVDAADDPVAAMKCGVEAIKSLPFMLVNPPPGATIKSIGDSNIVLFFTGWIDQRETDFLRARSLAIRAVIGVLDDEGFSMPEPIYRLRFDVDQGTGTLAEQLQIGAAKPVGLSQTGLESKRTGKSRAPHHDAKPGAAEMLNTRPDTIIDDMVNEERALQDENDLLDANRPVE